MATLGVGLLVGGAIFNLTGSSLSSKADEAWSQAQKAEEEIDQICYYLKRLSKTAIKYRESLNTVNRIYKVHFNRLKRVVCDQQKTDWEQFTEDEKLCTENTILLVGLLYNMCKVELVRKSSEKDGMNKINSVQIEKSIADANQFLYERNFSVYP